MDLLMKRQKFMELSGAMKGFIVRRAYNATHYGIARNLYMNSSNTEHYEKLEKYRRELDTVDKQTESRFSDIREFQARYEVEYELEERDTATQRLYDRTITEELFLFTEYNIDTYSNGWDMEDASTQDLLYEIADFLFQYKSAKFLVKNVKRL